MTMREWAPATAWALVCGLAWVSGCSTETGTGEDSQTGGGVGGMWLGGSGGVGATGGVGGSAGLQSMTGGSGGMLGAGSGGMAGTAGTGATGGAGGMAGSSGSGGMAGMNPEGGSGGTAGAVVVHEDQGMGDGSDVVTIGDSWMKLIVSGIEPSLDKAAGQTYRHRAQAGTLVLNEQIPFQYEQEVAADPDIKTVVMTGGGNDILGSPCADAACNAVVDDVFVRLQALYAQMAEDGVQDVVVVGYTHPANLAKHAALDYSIMRNEAECTTAMLPRCHFIDGSKLNLTLQDGIHPNSAGYDLLGKTVWELMVAEGIRR
jgi:hypothetical protein